MNSPQIVCSTAPPATVDVDLLVVPWFEDEGVGDFADLDRATGGEVSRALAAGEFLARSFDLFITPVVDSRWKARRVALCGVGKTPAYDTTIARRCATVAALAASQRHVPRVGYLLRPGRPDPSGDVDVSAFAQAVAEGLTLAEFNGATYKTAEPAPAAPPACTIAVPDVSDRSPESLDRIQSAAARGQLLAGCSNLARELANEPGNRLTPREFATRTAAIASEAGVTAEVLDERQIEALGMGLLLGVARGSSEPPRLMVFRY